MTIALIGSTIEPVISHRTSIVSPTSSPIAERQARADRRLLVDERPRRRRRPASGSGARRRAGRRRGRGPSRPTGSPFASTSICHVSTRSARAARDTRAHARARLRARRRSARRRRARSRGAESDDGDRARALAAGEVAVHGVGDGPRALALRDDGRVDRRPRRRAAPAARGRASARRWRARSAAGAASRRARAGTTRPAPRALAARA